MRMPGQARRATAEATGGEPSGPEIVAVSSRTRARRARPADSAAMAPPISSDAVEAENAIQAKADKGARLSKGNRNVDTEHMKNRFSVHRIREIAPTFDSTQKEWISKAGFGSLLSLSEFSVPVKLMRWIMKHVNPLLCEFRFRNKVIVFNRDLVSKILGLGNGNVSVKQSGDFADVQDLREVYKDGERAKIKKCVQLLRASTDRESFMRAFTLLALGTIYCPGTGNYVSLKYLHSLGDISQLQTYNWAGHVIEVLMDEVKKYQKLPPVRLEHDHQIGSCLPILAIAYMDHLNIPTDRGTHLINYNLPRICNVTNEDFEFVMKVDRNRMSLDNAYGKLPFRDFCHTPYAPAPSIEHPPAPAAEQHPAPDEVPTVSSASLDDWLQQPGPSGQCLNQLHPEYQMIFFETNNLMYKDIDNLAESVVVIIKDKIKALWENRCYEMMTKIEALNQQNSGSSGIFLQQDPPNPPTNADVAAMASTSGNVPSQIFDKVIEICDVAQDKVLTQQGNKIPTPTPSSDHELNKVPPLSNLNISEQANFYDDIPSFDLFEPGEIEDDICVGKDVSKGTAGDPASPTRSAATPPGDTVNNETIEISRGSKTHEKKNRRKRAAVTLNQGKKPKRIKLDEQTKAAY